MFNIKKLADFSEKAILRFTEQHQDEIFYAFSIDASLLCLNSLSSFEKTLMRYQQDWRQRYSTEAEIQGLKYNTGDWAYQGFARLTEADGFDEKLYLAHYYMSDEDQRTSDYGQAMDALLEELKRRDAFRELRKTGDFLVNRVEHTY